MSSESKRKITLVGFRQAKKGYTFHHTAAPEECKSCDLVKTCMESLEPGRVYTVTKVRNKTFPCHIHEEGVRVVEVEEPSLNVVITPRVAFPLATITFQPQDCGNLCCNSSKHCIPQGLVAGDKCKILEVKERLECPLKRQLVAAVVRRER